MLKLADHLAQPLNDALVDTFRALRTLNDKTKEGPPPLTIVTRGAGVDPKKVIRPGKRVRNEHRKSSSPLPLRQYAHIATLTNPAAVAWFVNKSSH